MSLWEARRAAWEASDDALPYEEGAEPDSRFDATPPDGLAFDYDRQVWTQGGRVLPCGHPDRMRPGCCHAGAVPR